MKKVFLITLFVLMALFTVKSALSQSYDNMTSNITGNMAGNSTNSSNSNLISVRINEIMYNPSGDDSGREWIELFHEQWLNLSGYRIKDSSSSDILVMAQSYNSSYSLIVEDSFNYSFINATVYYIGKTIGNGLSNSGENLSLIDNNNNNNTIHFISYNDSAEEGRSLEYFNGSLHESLQANGTPGYENSFKTSLNINDSYQNTTSSALNQSCINVSNAAENISCSMAENSSCGENNENSSDENSCISNSTLSLNASTEDPAANTTESDLTGNSTASENCSITDSAVENNDSTEQDEEEEICDPVLSISTEKEVYAGGESIAFRHIIANITKAEKDSLNITYWIEDINGNMIRQKKSTLNLNKKSFTPSPKKAVEVYMLKASAFLCESDAYYEKMVVVKSNITESEDAGDNSAENDGGEASTDENNSNSKTAKSQSVKTTQTAKTAETKQAAKKELTSENSSIKLSADNEVVSLAAQNDAVQLQSQALKKPLTNSTGSIYESKSAKAYDLTVYFFIALFVVLSSAVICFK